MTGRSAAGAPRTIADPTRGRRLTVRLVDVAVVAVVVLLAQAPLVPVFGASAAVPAILGGVLLGALLAGLALWRRWSLVVTIAVAVLGFALLGGVLALPTTTVAGVVPTGRTLRTLAEGVVTSWKQILTLEPPLGHTGTGLVAPLVLGLVAVLGGGLVAAGRATAVRLVTTAAIPVAVLVLSILLGTVEGMSPTAVGVTITSVLVVWAAWRRGQWRPRRVFSLAVLASVSIVGGLVLAPLADSDVPRVVLRSTIVPPFDPLQYASPLSGYRTFVKDQSVDPLLSVTDLPAGAVVRLATMDSFDGNVWNVMGSGDPQSSGAFRRIGDVVPTTIPGESVQVTMEVLGLTGPWVPTVGETAGITFSGKESDSRTNAFRFNDATGTGVLSTGVADGLTYTLDAVVPVVPTEIELEGARVGFVRAPAPVKVPDIVVSRSSEVTAQATAPATIARSLETYLSTSGFFSHGIEANGDYVSLPGHGAYRVNQLLGEQPMVGDAEQYASAMALMASQQGLPSRVVMGFIPDEEQDGQKTITFTGDQVQAWVEINYAGLGWVAYYPTPPTNQTPTPSEATEPTKLPPAVVQPPPPPPPPVVPPKETVEDPVVEANDQPDEEEGGLGNVAVIAAAVGIPLVLLLVPVLVVLALKAGRRRRRRRAPDLSVRMSGGWNEVLDTARDFGQSVPPEATRRETARALAAVFPQVPAMTLAGQADAATFSAAVPDETVTAEFWTTVDEARAAIRRQGSAWTRLRGTLSVASLRARTAATKAARKAAKVGADEAKTAGVGTSAGRRMW